MEGDSDLIVFPHIAEALKAEWDFRSCSIAFVRVSGKGSIARYRSFFNRFNVPVFVITDLDTIDDGFDKLEPTDEAKALRTVLIQKADAANIAAGVAAVLKTDDIKDAHAKSEIRRLWDEVRIAKDAFDVDKAKLPELDAAVEAFFSWEKRIFVGNAYARRSRLKLKQPSL